MTTRSWPLTIAMVGGKGVPATFGGVERVIEEVGARLVVRGHRVLVTARESYTGTGTGSADANRGMYRGMHIVQAPWYLKRKGFDSLSASATATLRLLTTSRWRPDLLHLHGLGVAPLALLARWAGARTVAQVHGIEWRNAQWSAMVRRFFRWCEWPLTRWADAVASGGQFDADGLNARHGVPVTALPNGVDIPTDDQLAAWRNAQPPADFAPFSNQRFVLFVGRLVPEKGPQHLLRAFAESCGTDDTHLVIVGDSPGRESFVEELRAIVPERQRQRVHFTGFRFAAELSWLWAHATVFVLPSESEGLSLTLLEALAHRVPTVVSDIRQNTDVSLHHARSFRTQDVASLAATLAAAVAAPPDATRLDAARAHVQRHYSWDAVVDAVEAIYRRVIDSDD